MSDAQKTAFNSLVTGFVTDGSICMNLFVVERLVTIL